MTRLAALASILLAVATLSCASLATEPMLVADLAGAAREHDGTNVQVRGVICDIGPNASLQPGPTCKDVAGISLDFDQAISWPEHGPSVVVSGLFRDNSTGDSSGPQLLNYPKNRYLGNYSISVRGLRVLP